MNIRADSQNPLPLPFLSDHHQRDGKIFRVCSLTAPMTYKLSDMDCSMPVDLLLQICKAMPIADLVRLLGVNRPLRVMAAAEIKYQVYAKLKEWVEDPKKFLNLLKVSAS